MWCPLFLLTEGGLICKNLSISWGNDFDLQGSQFIIESDLDMCPIAEGLVFGAFASAEGKWSMARCNISIRILEDAAAFD